MSNELKMATPESLGFSSKWVEELLDALEESRLCMHSFMLIRHGKVGAEGYWTPFDKDRLHRMYSVSKTFVAAAIGMLHDEGKLSLDDKIVKYFPDKLPDKLEPYIGDATIRDLLIMATPYETTTYGLEYDDWAWTFFNTPTNHPAGTIFKYDTSGTYILNVIVERIAGMPFLEYMREGLLDHIGFSEDAWCIKAPEGYSWGGSGVMATTRDLAKFALVFLNEGKYNGKQLISKEYIKAATTKQIDNNPDSTNYPWNNGYGYQIWIMKDGAFSFRGMGSQFAFCFPKQDFLFVCTADTQGDVQAGRMIYELVWHKIVKRLMDRLPGDEKSYKDLVDRCSSLEFIPIAGEAESGVLESVNNVTYKLRDNPMQISKLGISIDGDEGVLNYTNPRGDKRLYFGIKKYIECGFPETHYFGDTINKPLGDMYKSTNCAAWTEEDKLVIRSYIIDDHLGNLTITLSFKDDQISVYMSKTAEFFLNEYQGFAGGYKA
ncbi:MAG: serine hydrolase [Clostridiales bacterium]|nr:serine hydrolase [Clostridiales bacterium]